MHEIILRRAEFSNILSYGNNINEIKFEDGMTWIKGPNGAGKSVIIEVITFVWFGKAYRDINKKDIKNNANKSKLKASLEFDKITSEGTSSYIVTRTLTGSGTSTMEIFKNGEKKKKIAGITQKKLENDILGFNQNIFENVISLNTIQTKPFIDMDPSEKRKLVESVLTLHIDKYKDANKKALKEAQTKFISAESDVKKYSKDVEEMKEILEKLKDEKEEVVKKLKEQLVEAETNIKEHGKTLEVKESEKKKFTEEGVAKKAEIDALEDVEKDIAARQILLSKIEEGGKATDAKKALVDESDEVFKKYNNAKEIFDSVPEFNEEKYKKLSNDIKESSRVDSICVAMMEADQTKMNGIEDEVKKLKPGVPCEMCKKPSTKEDIEKIKVGYRERWKADKKSYDDNKAKHEKLIPEIEKMELEQNEMSANKDAYVTAKAAYDSTVLLKDKMEKQIKDATDNLVTINLEIEKLWKELGIEPVPVKKISKEIESLKEKSKNLSTMRVDLESIRAQVVSRIETIKNIKSNISTTENLVKSLKEQIEGKNEKDIDDAYGSAKKKFKGMKDDLERANTRISKYSDEIAITKYIEGMYNDTGIKKIVLGIFVPNLNKAIAHNLSLFELPFSIEFNDAMEYEFGSRFGMSSVYGGLSQGQRRKLNFAISIAFRDFVTAIADFRINILFLDEVLDISTDDEALSHMFSLLKNKVSEIGGIHLMTHRGQYFQENFDKILEVEHDGRYSSISKIFP